MKQRERFNDVLLVLDQLSRAIKALETLTPREEMVVRMRFLKNKTRSEVAYHCVLSKTRIQQIEQKALRKLRHPARARLLGLTRWRANIEG
jgi:RNA polymerase primary sigma factor